MSYFLSLLQVLLISFTFHFSYTYIRADHWIILSCLKQLSRDQYVNTLLLVSLYHFKDQSYSCNVLIVPNILTFELPFIRTVSLPFGVFEREATSLPSMDYFSSLHNMKDHRYQYLSICFLVNFQHSHANV